MTNRYRSGSEKKTGDLLDSLNISYSFEPHYINYTWVEYKKYLPDFKYTPIEQGIKETVKWFVENYDNARK